MKIPKPVDCGLPAKFTSWRANQEEAISVMITSKNRFTALSAPTGFGKSPAYVAHALLTGTPTCIVTNSKGLQSQLMADYKSVGMVDIRGKANYQCGLRDDYTCQEGHATRCPYKGTVQCPASQAEMRAASSRLVVTNYDKWITSARGREGNWMAHLSQVVFDEGHDAPDAVANAMQFTITSDDIEKTLKTYYPRTTDLFSCWKIWAENARIIALNVLQEWEQRILDELSPKPSWIRQYMHVKRLFQRLNTIATGRVTNWVVEETPDGFQFDPIRISPYAEGVLFLRRPRVIVVSATLRPKTMAMLGLRKDLYDFNEFPSDFDRNRCPIYWIPTMRVDSRAEDLSPLWIKLDQIMSRRMDRKGIIHTVSYARQQDVVRVSRHRGHMMVNVAGEVVTHVIDRFKMAAPGTVLVSPSVSTGYDFPGKDCEWQFIAKIPFQDGRSKINKARQADDKEYGPYNAMQTMVQTFGRGMRSKTDRCENFICDNHLEWFVPRYAHLAPKSFHSHFRRVEVVPQPPAALE
jgi:Rad3-related DNA helicase